MSTPDDLKALEVSVDVDRERLANCVVHPSGEVTLAPGVDEVLLDVPRIESNG